MNRRIVIYGGAAIALLIVLVLAFRPKPVKVEVARVVRGAMTAAVQDRGQTRVLDRFVISAPVAGNLERIPFRAGDAVKGGEVVARIAPASLSAVDVRQARAAVAQAEAAARQATANIGRSEARRELTEKELRRVSALRA